MTENAGRANSAPTRRASRRRIAPRASGQPPPDRNDQRRNRGTRRKNEWLRVFGICTFVRFSRQAKNVLTRTDSRHVASIFDIAASSPAIPGDQADQLCSRQLNPDERDRPREVDRGEVGGTEHCDREHDFDSERRRRIPVPDTTGNHISPGITINRNGSVRSSLVSIRCGGLCDTPALERRNLTRVRGDSGTRWR